MTLSVRTIGRSHIASVSALSATPFLAHTIAALILGNITGQPPSEVLAWTWTPLASASAGARLLALVFGLSGVLVALILPGLPWATCTGHSPLRPAALYSRAFAINLIQAVVFVGVWKAAAGHAPPRFWFVAWQAAITGAGLFSMYARSRRLIVPAADVPTLASGVLVVTLLLPTVLWNKTFVEDASGDGTEAFEFSRSLATHQLPHWDLENGYYGFYPQFMLFAYPTHLSFITVGESEGGQRLPVYFFLLGVFLILAEGVSGARARLSRAELGLLVATCAVFMIQSAYHTTYESPIDLGEPFGVDLFFTFVAAASAYALFRGHRAWWALFSLLATMALASGLVFASMALLGRWLAAGSPLRWKRLKGHVLDGLAFMVAWAGYQVFLRVYTEFYPIGLTKWDFGNVFERYPWNPSVATAITIVANLAVATAGLPLLGFLWQTTRDRPRIALAVLGTGYIVVLFLFGRTHPHYLTPIALLPVVLFLRALADGGRARRVWLGAYAVCLTTVLTMVLVGERLTHTVYRDFGRRTLFLYDAYPDAVEAARVLIGSDLHVFYPNGRTLSPWHESRVEFAEDPPVERLPGRVVNDRAVRSGARDPEGIPWGISYHTWVRYADRVPRENQSYTQIVAAPHLAPPAPEGYARRDLPNQFVLYFRPERSIFAWLRQGE